MMMLIKFYFLFVFLFWNISGVIESSSSAIVNDDEDSIYDVLHRLSDDISNLSALQQTGDYVFNTSTVIDLVKRLNESCSTLHLFTSNSTFAEELSKLTGRLLLSYFIAGPHSLDACNINTQNGYTGRLFLCLPGINCIKNDQEAREYWRSPRSELVHSFFQLSQVLPMGLMADKRVLDATRRLLLAGLNEGDQLSQHPTGWPPAVKSDASSFIITPVIMWQFASSYFFAGSRVERRFKYEMHKRIDYIAPRVHVISAAAAASSIREGGKVPSFLAKNDPALQGKLRLLVISTHWSPGHSSHRITASIVRSLARRSATNQSSIAVSLLYSSSQRDVADTFKNEGFIEAHQYTIADDDVVGAEALSSAIANAKFDAIFFPSLGMSGADVVIASHRMAPLQFVSYGHSASSFSPNVDVFLVGFETEIIGPVSSDVYDGSVDCSPVLDALVELTNLDAELNILPSSISPLCETSLPPNKPFSSSIRRRRQLARKRYSEAILFVPGLGMTFTSTFPAIAQSYRTPLSFSSIKMPSLISLAQEFRSIAVGGGQVIPSNVTGIENLMDLENSTLFYRGTRCFPIRVALVWSLVKWNSPHLERLFEIILRAKKLWRDALIACSEHYSSGVCLGLINAARSCSNDTNVIDTRLYVSLTAFTAIDTDAGPLKLLAVNALLSRLVSERFSDGTVTFRLLHNASQPISYLGALSSSDVAIDSSPFGACNAMQDFLSLGIPISGLGVVLDRDDNGDSTKNIFKDALAAEDRLRWRSTIGGSMQTKLGLTGLVALSEVAFYQKSSHLLFNPFLRLVWKRRMHTSDGNILTNGADEIGKEIEEMISSFNQTN
jgi:hypothetical protein